MREAGNVSFEVSVRPWADLVFHLLAHVPSATAASLFDTAYTGFASRHLGAAKERQLGEDVPALAALATEHHRYAALQGLAWLFSSIEEAEGLRERELGTLHDRDVTDGALLRDLCALGPAVEVLRCAAELEAEAHARLPPLVADTKALVEALERVARAAPVLPTYRIGIVRSLRLRGRVRRDEIWIGAPSEDPGPELAHVAWQAAHEATVGELARRLEPAVGDPPLLERAALVLLAERAARAGLAPEHSAWFSHFGLPQAALAPDSLPEAWRDAVSA
jgi:hypothetical protein